MWFWKKRDITPKSIPGPPKETNSTSLLLQLEVVLTRPRALAMEWKVRVNHRRIWFWFISRKTMLNRYSPCFLCLLLLHLLCIVFDDESSPNSTPSSSPLFEQSFKKLAQVDRRCLLNKLSICWINNSIFFYK